MNTHSHAKYYRNRYTFRRVNSNAKWYRRVTDLTKTLSSWSFFLCHLILIVSSFARAQKPVNHLNCITVVSDLMFCVFRFLVHSQWDLFDIYIYIYYVRVLCCSSSSLFDSLLFYENFVEMGDVWLYSLHLFFFFILMVFLMEYFSLLNISMLLLRLSMCVCVCVCISFLFLYSFGVELLCWNAGVCVLSLFLKSLSVLYIDFCMCIILKLIMVSMLVFIFAGVFFDALKL